MRFVYAFLAWLPRALLMLVAIGLLNFFLIRLSPGDPASVLAGEAGVSDPRFMEDIRSRYGLDQPLWWQAATYLRRLATLDLGVSYRTHRDVADIILERMPATLLLMSTALILAIVIGTLLGIRAARRAGTWQDTLIGAIAMLCYATPVFWVGLLLVLFFSVSLGILPPFGMSGFIPKSGLAAILDVLHHLILPVLTLTLFYFAVYVRLSRAAALEVLGRDFVRSARAKGLSEAQVLYRHVLRNSIIPVVTMAGLQMGQLLGGAIIVESIFAWPGVGRLAFDALMKRDYNLILGVFFVSSIMVVMANLLTDIVVRTVDPRVGRT